VFEVFIEVAVRIDTIDTGDLTVTVVVAQVLAPQPLVVERVLVAVGVGDQDEPQFGGLDQILDGGVVGAPPGD
jgi:hypothetical protein